MQIRFYDDFLEAKVSKRLHNALRLYRILQQLNKDERSKSGRFVFDDVVSQCANILGVSVRTILRALQAGNNIFWYRCGPVLLLLVGYRKVYAYFGVEPSDSAPLGSIEASKIAGNIVNWRGWVDGIHTASMCINVDNINGRTEKPGSPRTEGNTTADDMANRLGISKPTLIKRINDGWLGRIYSFEFHETLLPANKRTLFGSKCRKDLRTNSKGFYRTWEAEDGSIIEVRQCTNYYSPLPIIGGRPPRIVASPANITPKGGTIRPGTSYPGQQIGQVFI